MKPAEWARAVRDAPLDATTKAVAWALYTRMNGDCICWPSKEQLASDSGRSVRTVDRAIVRLETAGFVTRRIGGGRNRPTRYTARNPVTNTPYRGAKPRQERHINPVTVTGEVVKEDKTSAHAQKNQERVPLEVLKAYAESLRS